MILLGTVNFLFAYNVPKRVLDIGSQNMLRSSEEKFLEFLNKYGNEGDHEMAARELADRSITRPGHETLYLSELLDHTPVKYVSFDICPGRRTEILDINRDKLPWRHKNSFDLILNCGTSEHILNQVNVFNIIHHAAKIGAYIYIQVPTTGRIDHGYFCYHPKFFHDLAEANGYEVLELWYKRGFKTDAESGKRVPRCSSMIDTGIEIRGISDGRTEIPNHAICILLRKTQNSRFRIPIDTNRSRLNPHSNRLSLAFQRGARECKSRLAGLMKFTAGLHQG
ncbi:MAG: class I SAM-dependent methyltransferase [Alphaproteobacteria bacterium]|nr:class I SAM-dependent methyltransferase [Alphaproteobacteria bacterium]